jgi:hypothetical protein
LPRLVLVLAALLLQTFDVVAANRYVQPICESFVEIVSANQFHHIGEVLVTTGCGPEGTLNGTVKLTCVMPTSQGFPAKATSAFTPPTVTVSGTRGFGSIYGVMDFCRCLED